MESTTLNTYTAPMYIVELLTKILTAVGNITGGDGTDLQDIKTSISNIDTDTNDMNSKLTAISGDLTTASSKLNDISTTTNNISTTTNAISTTVESAKSTIDNIDNTLTTNVVTSIATLLEYTLAANNKLNFMNPTHLGVVAEGDTSFEQPVVLCNVTDSNITVTVTANQDTNPVSIPLTPGWNPVVVKAITGATANQLVYGF